MEDDDYSVQSLLRVPYGYKRFGVCENCSQTFPLPVDEMLQEVGPNAKIREGLLCLKCPHCGARSILATLLSLP